MTIENRIQQYYQAFDNGQEGGTPKKEDDSPVLGYCANWRKWQTEDDVPWGDPSFEFSLEFFDRYDGDWRREKILKRILWGFVEVLDPAFYTEYATVIREIVRREGEQRRHFYEGGGIFCSPGAIGVIFDGDEDDQEFLLNVKFKQCVLELQHIGKIPPIEAIYEETARIEPLPLGSYSENRNSEISQYLEAHLPQTDTPRSFDSFHVRDSHYISPCPKPQPWSTH